MVATAPTAVNKTSPNLVKGNTMHQIFSTNSCIYKISSSFERLYRIQYHREQSSNEVDETRIYKRVECKNRDNSSLRGTEPKRVSGDYKLFCNNRYDLFKLVKADVNGKYHTYGFMIEQKKEFFSQADEPQLKFFYEFEVKERKER